MPRGDGTGPLGLGPMTGRAMGFCAGYPAPGFMNPRFGFGFGLGRGMGFGRGRGWRRGGYGPLWGLPYLPYGSPYYPVIGYGYPPPGGYRQGIQDI